MTDVVIVGGGMVGSALACALGQAGLRVAMVEASEPSPEADWQGVDPRVSAVTRASQHLFQNLGSWGGMLHRRATPYREMRVWDAASGGSLHFDCADLGEPDLGHIIENRVVQTALAERIAELPEVRVYRPARPRGLRLEAGSAYLELERETLVADLVVGADGAHSRVRELACMDSHERGYGHSALVATIHTERHHGHVACQRFLPGGPLAWLPAPDGYSSMVWSAAPARIAELEALDDEAFRETLAEAMEHRLGRVEWAGARASFPLRARHAERYVQARVALAGDAAHTIHPLAGQGVNLGLLDAALLAGVLIEARKGGRDLGGLPILRPYERGRRGHNQAVQGAMAGLQWVFGAHARPFEWLRGTGLRLTDSASPIKARMMRQAMGLTGDLPALARRPPEREAWPDACPDPATGARR